MSTTFPDGKSATVEMTTAERRATVTLDPAKLAAARASHEAVLALFASLRGSAGR